MNFTISKKTLIIYGSLFLSAIIFGIIIGCCAKDAAAGLWVTLAIATMGVMPVVKKAVLWVGRKAVDFSVALDFVVIMSILFAGIYVKIEGSYLFDVSYWWYVLTAIFYLVYAALKNFVLYLFIDMRDSLKKLSDGEDSAKEGVNDMKKCPHCGADIKITAKKCRYCGEWLEENNNQRGE